MKIYIPESDCSDARRIFMQITGKDYILPRNLASYGWKFCLEYTRTSYIQEDIPPNRPFFLPDNVKSHNSVMENYSAYFTDSDTIDDVGPALVEVGRYLRSAHREALQRYNRAKDELSASKHQISKIFGFMDRIGVPTSEDDDTFEDHEVKTSGGNI